MLVMLFIKMIWYKNDRNPRGAVIRKPYYEQVVVEDLLEKCKSDETINNASVLIQKITCTQNGKEIKQTISSQICDINSVDELAVPNITIISEEYGYRVKWFETGRGCIKRRGGNEDFGMKGRKLAGVPNVLNETAFILGENQSGKISWNNRFSSYHGQWYEQYQLYMVNINVTDENKIIGKINEKCSLDAKLFFREYDFEYQQMADLF